MLSELAALLATGPSCGHLQGVQRLPGMPAQQGLPDVSLGTVLMLAAPPAQEDEEEEEAVKKEEKPMAAEDPKKKKKKKRLGKSIEEASLDPNKPPAKLTAPLLDRLMRIWVMLSQASTPTCVCM
eukprot:1157540-Pelagomonas_calceolata.AAC.3